MWTLILFAYANMMASGDSVAFTNVNFVSQKSCVSAGEQATTMAKNTAKTIRYICVETR
jgi:hypothetical protein